jgi:hypothetical protein
MNETLTSKVAFSHHRVSHLIAGQSKKAVRSFRAYILERVGEVTGRHMSLVSDQADAGQTSSEERL